MTEPIQPNSDRIEPVTPLDRIRDKKQKTEPDAATRKKAKKVLDNSKRYDRGGKELPPEELGNQVDEEA